MTHPDAKKWNGRYAIEGAKWLKNAPNQLLQKWLPHLPRNGLALDAASGVSVNGLALAQHGLRVFALDISEVGLQLARQLFAKNGLRVETAVYDLAHPWFPPNSLDVVINFRFLERATFPIYRQAIKPGGWLLFETFVKTDCRATYPSHYLDQGELLAEFSDFQIYENNQVEIWRGNKLYKTSEMLVAQKPLNF